MRVILNGGGAGEKNETINLFYSQLIDKKLPTLYIPVALEESKYPQCEKWINEELNPYGIHEIEMCTDSNKFCDLDLYKYSSIYIGGGNTYRLLHWLKKTYAYNKLEDFIRTDGVVFGGSAGATIFGLNLNSINCKEKNDYEFMDVSCYNVVNNYSVFTHFRSDEVILSEVTEKFIGIPEESSLFVENDKITVIGESDCYFINYSTNVAISGKNYNLSVL